MPDVPFGRFAFRVTCCHMVTYFVAGVAAMFALNYQALFQSDTLACYMLPVDAPVVALGPALQILRGLVIAAALYPFRRVFLEAPRGWLLLWGLIAGLSILSAVGPAPGSIEGMIYTKPPILNQLAGYFEVVPQTLAFAALVVGWHRRPSRAWTVVMTGLSCLVLLTSALGYAAATGHLPRH